MADYNEYKLEQEIAEYLAAHGWLYSTNDDGYDKERALFPADVLGWLEDTQPADLAKVVRGFETELRLSSTPDAQQLLDRLVKELGAPLESGGGTLNVLRQGFSHISARFSMAQFAPESTLNPSTTARYGQMRLRAMRQVHYSTATRHSLDLVLFVNGLPVATLELKTDFTQGVQDAIAQYKHDRPVKDPATGKPQLLFGFGRALVHFAVSNDEVWMTTKLAGPSTYFLPFNRGTADGGAGNPPAAGGASASAYLWRQILQRDTWLAILGRFLHLDTRTNRDPISGLVTKTTTLLFPRFHQWDVVTRLAEAVAVEGPGQKYLVQHSAGSGKTNSIAWTAHRLARMQVNNEKVFDTVIVVTDRTVLDAQLQEAIKQIDVVSDGHHGAGIVTAIDVDEARRQGATSKSDLLGKALAGGKLIVVVTIQTFPHVMREIRGNLGLGGKRYAVIADEAHSSQTGNTAAELRRVLTAEELAAVEDGGEIDVEAALAADAENRGRSSNISYFAFTATPKAKTLELFGREPDGGGQPQPFHVYTMKQAIEERYILDVLRGYQSFQLAFRVAGAADAQSRAETEVDQAEATKRVKRWVRLNPQTIAQKSALIVEHFRENVAGLLEGHAKAMVVADSRLAAVRYKREIDKYVTEKGYDIGTLVAFSGSISDAEYAIQDATEASLNPGAGDLRKAFEGDDRKVMIVANKFQTGFDQPLLCSMYVDRRLAGVTAVQTLSRLNRTYRTPSGQVKDTTSVVDFVNVPEDIRDAFEPYFTEAFLENSTDPNLVWDVAKKLDHAGVYETHDLDAVADAWVRGKGNQALDSAFGPVVSRYDTRVATAVIGDDKAELDALAIFRKDLGTFVRVYDFMSQIVEYGSADLEKRSIFYRLLDKRLERPNDKDDIDLSSLSLVHVHQVDQGRTDLDLGARVGLTGMTEAGSAVKHDPKRVALQEVLDRLNDLFGAEEFSTSQPESFVDSLMKRMLEDDALVQQAKVNNLKQFAESPDFDSAVVDAVSDNQDAHARIADFIYSGAPGRAGLILALAKAFHEHAADSDVA